MSNPELSTSLVQYGTADDIRRAIAAGADIEARDEHHRTPLMIAVECGNLQTARALLEAGANVETRDDDVGQWSQRLASMVGADTAVAIITSVLEAQGDAPELRSGWLIGRTSLHLAVELGDAAMTRLLLDHGADATAQGGRQQTVTVFELAVSSSNVGVLDALLERPWPNVHELGLDAALTTAAIKRKTNFVRRLLRAGAEPAAPDAFGHTLVDEVVEHNYEYDPNAWRAIRELVETGVGWSRNLLGGLSSSLASFQEVPMLRVLIEGGADVDATSRSWGDTALMDAAKSGARFALQCLLEYGADMELEDGSGETALMLVADQVKHDGSYHHEWTMVRLLLDAGADPNHASRTPGALVSGETAIMHADARRSEYLLLAGADPSAQTGFDAVPTFFRPFYDGWFEKYPIPTEVLRFGTASEIRQAMAALPEQPARDTLSFAPLLMAVGAGNIAGARALLELRIDPNIDVPGTAALHVAVTRVDLDSAEMLLDAGADPNHYDEWSLRPLDFLDSVWPDQPAPRVRSAALIRMLLEAGTTNAPSPIGYRNYLLNWYRYSDHDGSLEPAWVHELLPWITDVEEGLRSYDPTPLTIAAANGDVHTARLVLGMGADPTDCPEDPATPLMHAAAAGHRATALIHLLLDAGATIDGDDGVAALIAAARAGSTDAIRALLAHGVEPDGWIDGETALMRAAATGGRTAVTALLEAGADPNAAGKRHGWTPLMWAARHSRDAGVLTCLLDAGANVTTRTPRIEARSGLDPAYRATLAEIPQERLAVGLSPGFTALMAAAIRTPSKRGTAAMINTLLAAGADANATCDDGRTASTLAQAIGAPEPILRRLEAAEATGAASVPVADAIAAAPRPAPPRSPSTDPTLALIQAARRNDLDGLHRLIATGAVQQPGTYDWGTTPLLSAFERGHLEAVHLFLDAGADPEARDRQGHTLLARVARTPLEPTRNPANADLLQRLLRQGADHEARTAAGWTPLMLAACHDQTDAARALIQAGAQVDARGGPWGTTALMIAARWGLRTDVIEVLLDAGCDLESRTTASENPRWTTPPTTLRRMHPPASPNPSESAPGRTALMCAAARRFRRHTTEALDALIAAGADVHARSDLGHSALQFATTIDPESATVQRLLETGATQ